MDSLFLEANVLFSAAYRLGAGVVALWSVTGATLSTSTYAVQEVRRNPSALEQLERLTQLLQDVRFVEAGTLTETVREGITLPEKDGPVFAGAITARATHLITGDRRHFGLYSGKRIGGPLVLPPADYLQYVCQKRGRR